MRWGDCIQPKGGFLNERAARDYVKSIENCQSRQALEAIYNEIVYLSCFRGIRPQGAFDVLYVYRVLASCFERGWLNSKLPEPDDDDSW